MAELDTITIGELPTITEIGENDTVLIASGGRMKKASPSLVGGGSTLVATASYSGDPQADYTITLDKTYAEIEEAMLNGSVIVDMSAAYTFFGYIVPTGAKNLERVTYVGYSEMGANYMVRADEEFISATKSDYPTYDSGGIK